MIKLKDRLSAASGNNPRRNFTCSLVISWRYPLVPRNSPHRNSGETKCELRFWAFWARKEMIPSTAYSPDFLIFCNQAWNTNHWNNAHRHLCRSRYWLERDELLEVDTSSFLPTILWKTPFRRFGLLKLNLRSFSYFNAMYVVVSWLIVFSKGDVHFQNLAGKDRNQVRGQIIPCYIYEALFHDRDEAK